MSELEADRDMFVCAMIRKIGKVHRTDHEAGGQLISLCHKSLDKKEQQMSQLSRRYKHRIFWKKKPFLLVLCVIELLSIGLNFNILKIFGCLSNVCFCANANFYLNIYAG